MPLRVAEYVMRTSRFGPKVLFRVDLHGVSVFGPGDVKTLIRWEWIDSMDADDGHLVVASTTEKVRFPSGAFGREPQPLLDLLEAARSITDRADVIAQLAGN